RQVISESADGLANLVTVRNRCLALHPIRLEIMQEYFQRVVIHVTFSSLCPFSLCCRLEDLLLRNYYTAFCSHNQLPKGVLNPQQARMSRRTLVDYIQPVTLTQVARFDPFILGDLNVTNASAAFHFDTALLPCRPERE